MAIGTPRQQSVPFDRAGHCPPARGVGSETKTAIIAWIADHHQRRTCVDFGRIEQGIHQRATNAHALCIGQHRDRADHDERVDVGVASGVCNRPALQRAHQFAISKGCKAERAYRHRPLAQAIGGAGMAIRPERGIEQRLNLQWVNRRQGFDLDQLRILR